MEHSVDQACAQVRRDEHLGEKALAAAVQVQRQWGADHLCLSVSGAWGDAHPAALEDEVPLDRLLDAAAERSADLELDARAQADWQSARRV